VVAWLLLLEPRHSHRHGRLEQAAITGPHARVRPEQRRPKRWTSTKPRPRPYNRRRSIRCMASWCVASLGLGRSLSSPRKTPRSAIVPSASSPTIIGWCRTDEELRASTKSGSARWRWLIHTDVSIRIIDQSSGVALRQYAPDRCRRADRVCERSRVPRVPAGQAAAGRQSTLLAVPCEAPAMG
jgi:hypothetical protein